METMIVLCSVPTSELALDRLEVSPTPHSVRGAPANNGVDQTDVFQRDISTLVHVVST